MILVLPTVLGHTVVYDPQVQVFFSHLRAE